MKTQKVGCLPELVTGRAEVKQSSATRTGSTAGDAISSFLGLVLKLGHAP